MLKNTTSKSILSLIVIFILSRIIYFLAGVRFDITPLDYFWQFIDPALLKSDLLTSLYYLHCQPPLFNLFLGIVLKLFAGNEAFVFHSIYLVIGLVICVSIFLLMVRVGISNRLGVILTVLLIVSPSGILYENFLFYTYPVTAALLLSALCLFYYLKKGNQCILIIFFTLLAGLILTRSMFHLVWLLIIILLMVFLLKKYRKTILIIGGTAFILCFLLYAKNSVVFGSFSTSSWTGMNISRLTTWQLPVEERYRLIEKGKISTLSLVKPFRRLETYQRHSHFPTASKTGIPVLDMEVKSTGASNMNNLTYVDISRQYYKDAGYVLTHYPSVYLKSLLSSWHTYCVPSSSYSFLKDNRKHIEWFDRMWNIIVTGQYDYEETITDHRSFFNTGLLIAFIYLLMIVYGFIVIKRLFTGSPFDSPFYLTLLFMWFNVVYITVVGNAFELGENNRFRFIADPFVLIFLGLAIENKFSSKIKIPVKS